MTFFGNACNKSAYHYYRSLHQNISHCFIAPQDFETINKDYFAFITALIEEKNLKKDLYNLGQILNDMSAHQEVLHFVAAHYPVKLIDHNFEEKIISMREVFQKNLPPSLQGKCHFYDEKTYHEALSIEDNIFFGTPSPLIPDVEQTLRDFLHKGLQAFDLEKNFQSLALSTALEPSFFTPHQKQKIALFRALYQTPEVLILDGSLNDFSPKEMTDIGAKIEKWMQGKTILFIPSRARHGQLFETLYVLDNHGQIAEKGTYAELLAGKGLFYTLIKEEK